MSTILLSCGLSANLECTDAGLKCAAYGSLEIQDAKMTQKKKERKKKQDENIMVCPIT